MSFDPGRLGDMLVCPACHNQMVMHDDALVDVSPECRRSFQIVDGIPRLLVSDSEELSPDAWGSIMSQHNRDSTTGAILSEASN